MLISALGLMVNARAIQLIYKHYGVRISESTWRRWRAWWKHSFTETAFWRQMQGSIVLALVRHKAFYPRNLFSAYLGSFEEKLMRILVLLSPLTSGDLRAV